MKGRKNTLPTIHVDAGDSFGLPRERGTPERNLVMATLERAILDYVGNHSAEVKAAEEWIFADTENFKPVLFSFAWVCEQLDLDPQKIAQIIKDMPKRGDRRVAPWYFKNNEQMCA